MGVHSYRTLNVTFTDLLGSLNSSFVSEVIFKDLYENLPSTVKKQICMKHDNFSLILLKKKKKKVPAAV